MEWNFPDLSISFQWLPENASVGDSKEQHWMVCSGKIEIASLICIQSMIASCPVRVGDPPATGSVAHHCMD